MKIVVTGASGTTGHGIAEVPGKRHEVVRAWRLAALAALTLAVAACSEAQPQSEAPKPVVETRTIAFAPDRIERRYTGVLRTRHEADQAFRVGGKIVERPVDVGDRVEAGQRLASLDPQDLDLEVGSAGAELTAAKAAVAQASSDAERARRLMDRNFASTSDFERRDLALDEARGRLDKAERELALAKNQRSYAALTASVTGIVTAVSAEAGQVVALGAPIVTIAALDQTEIEVAIPEGRLEDLKDARASVTLWAATARFYPAKLRELSPEADPASRTYAARFTLEDPGEEARFGMTATLALEKGSGRPVASLPLSAVIDQGNGPAVYVVAAQSDTLVLKPVEIVRYGAAEAVISGGVSDGDRVVTLGVNRLTPDLAVRVAEAKTP